MNETENMVFEEAGKVKAAINKMTKAMGTEKEGAAALAFAKSMTRLYEEGAYIEKPVDIRKEKRLLLLRAYYDTVKVHMRLLDDLNFVIALQKKYDGEYCSLGGSWYENEAYRTGKTEAEVIAESNEREAASKKKEADHLKELGL
ncbi:hypothetical protein FACS1894137_18440 [Spirochaetia bacterium]|nr:hypothetical protein FACS1894137_18440 [Spirochaetia bacterium]